MTILHVKEEGATVRRDMEQIKVTVPDVQTRKQKILATVPVRELEQLVVYGYVQVTTQAIKLLMQHNIDIVYLNHGGGILGHTLSTFGSKFARLRHEQLKLSGDADRSLAIAKAIVRTKLANQRNTLNLLTNDVAANTARTLREGADRVERMRGESSRARTLDQLRGFEGRAGADYFAAVRSLLDPAWSFRGRIFHPPPDPVNALLSFGYALLLKDVNAIAQIVGLDPYLGCFHALEYNRPSLILDLMEEFRPLAVDRAMLHLVLTGTLRPADFTFTGRENRPVELGDALLPLVIDAYEAQMQTVVAHPTGGNSTLRRCLELQARIFARTVIGTRREYEGLVA